MNLNKLSRKIAYLLRHAPGFTDANGYADVSKLIAELQKTYPEFRRDTLDEIVQIDEKGRYSYDESGQRIRAN